MALPAMRRGCPALNGSLTIIVLTPLTTFSGRVAERAESDRQAYEFVGVFFIVMSGPAGGRHKRAMTFRALLPCLALIALDNAPAHAQALTSDLFRPVQDGFVAPQDLPLRRTAQTSTRFQSGHRQGPEDADAARLRNKNAPAPSRIGQIPSYGLPAANGASDSGFNSLNRTRKKPKLYPGQAKPKPSPGPGTPAPAVAAPSPTGPPPRLSISTVAERQQDAIAAGDGRHRRRPAAAQAPQGRRRSVRRGRRLCRQLPDQVRGRTLAAATTPIPAGCRRRWDRRSTWSRRNSSRSPTGNATRWSPICGDRSPAMATRCRRPSMAASRRRRPISTVPISPAISTAGSMSPTTPA